MKTIVSIDGMTCEHCAATVEKALLNVTGVEKAKVKLKKALVKVTYHVDQVTEADLKEAIVAAGYQVKED